MLIPKANLRLFIHYFNWLKLGGWELVNKNDSLEKYNDYIYMRGRCYFQNQQFSEAIQDFSSYINSQKDKPQDSQLARAYSYRGRARLKFGQGRGGAADFDLIQAVELGSQEYDLHHWLAGVYRKSKQPSYALPYYDRSLKLANRQKANPHIITNIRLDRALLHIKLGDFTEAVNDLERAIEKSPRDYRGYADLALLYAVCEDPAYLDGAKALKLAQKAMDIEVNSRTCEVMAAACAEVGQFEKAVEMQHKSAALFKPQDGKEAEIYIHRIVNQYRKGIPRRFFALWLVNAKQVEALVKQWMDD